MHWNCWSLWVLRAECSTKTSRFPTSLSMTAHRRMSQGAEPGGRGAAASQTRAKPIIFFGQKLNFSGRSQQPKMKEIVVIKRKKRNSFCLARYRARNQGFLLIITGWGESGKVILQVSIAVLSGAVEKFFGQRWLTPPRKKLARTPMWPPLMQYWVSCMSRARWRSFRESHDGSG